MKSAATLTQDKILKRFLSSRADTFLSNDYVESDRDWMDLDGHIDLTIGPYETYADELFGYKAAFQSRIILRDSVISSQQARFNEYLEDIDLALPVVGQFTRQKQVPRVVVGNQILAGGDGAVGYIAVAYMLPNDHETRTLHGSKKVLMKNFIDARMKHIVSPIGCVLLDPSQVENVTSKGYFNFVLLHELSHGLGPGKIGSEQVTIKDAFKDLYGAFEEAKADAYGLYLATQFANIGVLTRDQEAEIYTSYLASIFRTFRTGLGEAHAKAELMEYNYLLEKEGVRYDPINRRFSVDYEKAREVVYSLLMNLLNIQASGEYQRAKDFSHRYGNDFERLPDEVAKGLDLLRGVPKELLPVFQAA